LTFSREHGNDCLFARFYRHPGSAILLQKQVSKASIAKIVGVSLPPFTALSRQDGYAHTLKGYFYTNLGGTLNEDHFHDGKKSFEYLVPLLFPEISMIIIVRLIRLTV
jgi:hypothetical protein